MREIKFRAWDSDTKHMIYGGGFFPPIRDEGWFFGLLVPYKDCEVMQFTGLHDKNGKEIYEGDIVKHVGIKDYRVVKFEKGAFTVGEHNGSSTKVTPMLLCSRDEVIGNIYENPELLKE